jgi:hypothetical protein
MVSSEPQIASRANPIKPTGSISPWIPRRRRVETDYFPAFRTSIHLSVWLVLSDAETPGNAYRIIFVFIAQ